MPRETLEFDVVIVGAGPAGLSCACRLAQLAQASGTEISICVIEKGAAVGAHIVSGAVLEPRALEELFPDWRERSGVAATPVSADRLAFLASGTRSIDVPRPLVPRALHNAGNFIISLGDLCVWLGREAEALGCNVLPGFAAVDLIVENDRVAGVVTGDMGRDRSGAPKPTFQEGYELRAKHVVLAEGCRGNLGKQLERRFELRRNADPQHYGIGLKEIWQVDPALHRPGEVLHTFGWPLDLATDGGGFLYHAAGGRVYVGLVISLGYRNPHLDPFAEFQRWKQHPAIRRVLAGGERVAYGARAVNKGGLGSLPQLAVPGAVLIGCDAGFLNPAKLKGSHTAMKTGMLAAEALHAAFAADGGTLDGPLEEYPRRVRDSWVWEELHAARNFSAGMAKLGTVLGGALAVLEQNVLRGRAPWTLRHPVPDHARLEPADAMPRIAYPKPDGAVSFDRASSVFLSNTVHEEDQPSHLRLRDPSVPVKLNLPRYDEPAQRYCPAGVYEIVGAERGEPRLQINAANCVHCKTCDIKDPAQNIEWVPPEGGGGPSYAGM